MIKFRKATSDDISKVLTLYKDLINAIKHDKHTPEWEYGVYPKEENIIASITSNELYVGEINSTIVSSMVVNHTANNGYENIKWNIDYNYDDVYVIHLVAVKPECRKRGIAKKMLDYVIDNAVTNNIKSIRLSIIKNNIPAEKLYKKFDFKYVDSMDVDDIDRGLKSFKVYEKIL